MPACKTENAGSKPTKRRLQRWNLKTMFFAKQHQVISNISIEA